MSQCLEAPIAQGRLKELLFYDQDSGFFFWKESRGRVRRGELAGSVSERKSDGYKRVAIRIDGVSLFAHRLAWLYLTGEWPAFEIDHIDRNALNNSWNNLRAGGNGVNARNRKKYSVNTSGYNGVSWCKRERKWRAYCTFKGRMRSLGYYSSCEEAAEVSRKFREEHGFSERHGT